MKIAYFDCFAGIAGDMALAALLDCGVPLDELKKGLSSLPVSGWDISVEDVLRGGIHAKNARVMLNGKSDEDEAAGEHRTSNAERPTSNHEHHHDHHHGHEHHHHHEPRPGTSNPEHGTAVHVHGRSMAEIRALIEASELSARVKETSLKIFGRIAVAEAYLHHSTPEEIHFHEIGGVDSLIDICGVAWCVEYLGVEEIYSSALPHSSGHVDCAHGRMPVPAPATLEILKDAGADKAGAKWTPTEIVGELVTPTGAGILAALSQSFGAMPEMKVQKIGIGAGKKTLSDRPNLLRVAIGDVAWSTPERNDSLAGLECQTLCVLECNIDDMNPELYDGVNARLFEEGALDVWMQPIQMKKNRPGVLLGVLCETGARDVMLTTLLQETTTLGVRESQVRRHAMARTFGEVQTELGAIKMKIAYWPQAGVWRATPEYADALRAAKEKKVPLQDVYQAAQKAIGELK